MKAIQNVDNCFAEIVCYAQVRFLQSCKVLIFVVLIQEYKPQRFQVMWNITQCCSIIIGCVIDKIFNQCAKLHCTTEVTLHNRQ